MFLELLLATVFGVLPAEAKDVEKCKKDFQALQKRSDVSLIRQEVVNIERDTDLSQKRRIVQESIASYLKITESEIPEWGLEVEVRKYMHKTHRESIGYKVTVNGGDEALVELYFKIYVGSEDVYSNLLYYVWHNQSPVRAWVCERY